MPNPPRRAGRALLIMVLIGGTLVATHEGEFWPFSIYPMFSQAGRPWNRMLVRDVTTVAETELTQDRSPEDLPGSPLALHALGIPQNDFNKLIKLTDVWTDERKAVLRGMFQSVLDQGRTLLVYRVHGDVTDDGQAYSIAEPLVLLDRERARVVAENELAQNISTGP